MTFTAINTVDWRAEYTLVSNAPSTQKGSLAIRAADNDANYQLLITNGAQSAARTATIPILSGNASFVMSTGTSTNTTSTSLEFNTLTDVPVTMTTTATPASGSNGVQFVFKNAAGATIGAPRRAFQMFLSDVNGDVIAAATSVAALTNGKVTQLVTGQIALAETSAAGLLGVTLTHGTPGSYYLSFVMPSGKVVTSDILTVN